MLLIAKAMLIFITAILFLFFYARYLENKSLYYPVLQMENTPAAIGLEYQDLFFNTQDQVRLNAWFIKAKNSKATLIFAHGNGGNISHRLEKIAFLNQLGLNIFMFDYRGYGKSQGVPSERGLYLDIRAAYEFIKNQKIAGPLVIYGESLGGAIAIDLAGQSDIVIDGLILEGTFTNVQDMARTIYPFLPAVFLKTKFASIDKISKVKVPKLHLHSQDDDIVPFALGRKLFNAGNNPKKFIALDGGHNDCFFISQNLVASSIEEFIDSVCSGL
ncbi:MAG: alpha/beta hydrolase [Candidatus Omnitrophica bacterium]|nr:alpha/beta hydrolase [Candidatus Omnitrophota bacterium]